MIPVWQMLGYGAPPCSGFGEIFSGINSVKELSIWHAYSTRDEQTFRSYWQTLEPDDKQSNVLRTAVQVYILNLEVLRHSKFAASYDPLQ